MRRRGIVVEDRETLRALVRKADVFAQSYRPRSISRMFPPDELAALRPGIVYVSLSCYAFEGPWRNRPGWEQLAQSATGIAAFEGSLEERKLARHRRCAPTAAPASGHTCR